MVSSFIIVVVTSKILESHTFLGSEYFKSVVWIMVQLSLGEE